MTALLALLASLVWGSSDFVGGVVSRRVRPLLVVGVAHGLAAATLVLVAAVASSFGDDLGYLPWAIAAGATGCVGLIAFYRALSTGTMGIVAPIAGTGAVVPVAVGLAGGDAPSALQLTGIGVAVVGVVLASGPELTGAGRGGRKPVALALVAALGFGLVYVFIDHGASRSVVMTLLVMRLTSVALVAAFVGVALACRDAVGDFPGRRELALIAFVGWTDAAANGLYAVASQRGFVSVVAVLASLYPAVTVLLARVIEHERMRRIQSAGVVFALCGVVLLAAG